MSIVARLRWNRPFPWTLYQMLVQITKLYRETKHVHWFPFLMKRAQKEKQLAANCGVDTLTDFDCDVHWWLSQREASRGGWTDSSPPLAFGQHESTLRINQSKYRQHCWNKITPKVRRKWVYRRAKPPRLKLGHILEFGINRVQDVTLKIKFM